MPHTPYQAQLDAKNRHRNIILNALKDSPKRFSELAKSTGFSDAGLDKMLKGLRKDKLIEHDSKNKLYSLTNHGLKILQTADISYITNRIQSDNGMYYPRYSGVSQSLIPQRASGAIRPFLYIDKNLDSLNLVSTNDVEEIEKIVFRKLSKNIRRNKLIEKNTGDIVLGFVIDYHKTEKLLSQKKQGKMK